MPRKVRLDAPGLLHHVVINGIRARGIFKDEKDRKDFITRLSILLPQTKTRCYGWVLTPNNAHFLLRSGPSGISRLMRRLLTGYAVSYNKRHRERGRVFQNRYKSVIFQEALYLRELIRYIHLIPLSSKTVPDLKALDHYPYCGHSALMGKEKVVWQDVEYVLEYFGNGNADARKKYRHYVEKGVSRGRRPELGGDNFIKRPECRHELKSILLVENGPIEIDQRVLGEKRFIKDVFLQAEEGLSLEYRPQSSGFNFDKIVDRVSQLFSLEKGYITGRGRQSHRVRARDLACYWSVVDRGISMADLADRLGLTLAAVSYAVKRGEEVAKEGGYLLEG